MLASFVSGYELTANKLVITVYEDYRTLFYPKDSFGQFKEVINAAADFNKVALIFAKK